MARAIWLASVLRNAGLRVVEMDGWETRETRAGFDPQGIVWHHTATSAAVPNANVRRLLRDGRSDLAGPLSQLGLERDGTYVVIAAGRCNHNGYGQWGNDSIGIEAYNDGRGERWSFSQLDAYDRGTAAICRALGVDASQVKGHRETDPGRKIDPTGIDMDAARSRVTGLLKPTKGVDEMLTYEYVTNGKTILVCVTGGKQVRLTGPTDILKQRRACVETHMKVDADDAARFKTAFGAVIGL